MNRGELLVSPVKNIRNDVRQIQLVWGSLTLAPIRVSGFR